MKDLQLAVPDVVSSSYFPALAATRMTDSNDTIHLSLAHIFPAKASAEALREGAVQFMAGPAHAMPLVFHGWHGAKILMALSQHTYWMLVVRNDIPAEPNNPEDLHDLVIAAAPGPDRALQQLLRDWGIDPNKNRISLVPPPGGHETDDSFGVRAVGALTAGTIDGFWANSMAAEIAVSTGAGRVLLDPRRGDGPEAASTYTFPALLTTEDMIKHHREDVDATVRAVMRAQVALKGDPESAARLVNGLFPPRESGLISKLVRRDAPYYSANVDDAVIAGLNRFSRAVELLDAPVHREALVDTESPAL